MTTMIAEPYDALLSAGAADDKARRAAEAMANYDNRFDGVDRRFDTLEADIDRRFDALEADIDRRFDAVGRRFDGLEADINRRFDGVDRRIDGVKADLELQIAGVRSEITLLKWMVGAVFALLVPVFLRTFIH